MKNIFLVLILVISFVRAENGPLRGFPSFSRGDVSIYVKIQGKNFDPNLPKKFKFPPIHEVIRASDAFLQKTFGANFSAPIRKISFDRYMGDDKEFVWCWVVTYFDPDYLEDVKSARIFHIYLDINGNSLMEVKKK